MTKTHGALIVSPFFPLCLNIPLFRLFLLPSVTLTRSVPPCLDQCAWGGLCVCVCRYVWVEGMGWGYRHMTTRALLYAFTIDDPLCVWCMSTRGWTLCICVSSSSLCLGGTGPTTTTSVPPTTLNKLA